MSSDLAVREPQTLAGRYELEVEDLVAQVQKIQQLMTKVMKEGEHYGVIPGTGTKPTLLKPGAEKLCQLFRLAPDPHSVDTYDGKHLTTKSRCDLYHIPTGQKWGAGEGSCSTKESKYAYRKADRTCPACSNATIRKSKDGGWFCWRKLGGCGRTFPEGTGLIEKQAEGRVANEDVADQYNTVLKMANKRALVAAVLNVTAASDIFTQDLEDMAGETPPPPPPGGEVIESTARTVPPDQDATDRHRLVDQIDTDARFIGWTRGEYKARWRHHVGPVKIEDAPIAGVMALADELAELVKVRQKELARQKGAQAEAPTTSEEIPF